LPITVEHKMFDKKDEDLEFVNSLYGHTNARSSKRANWAFLIIIVFVVSVIAWAYVSEIDEIARGDGKVIPSSKIQKVQNLDGGIISDILVKEGDNVKKGAILMKIDSTRYQASLEGNKQEYISLLAVKVRLETEVLINTKKRIPKLKFPKEVLDNNAQYEKFEIQLFNNRVKELKIALKVLKNQHAQKVQELSEIRAMKNQLSRTLKLIKEQRVTMKKLARAGIKSKFDVLNVEKEYNKAFGDLDAAILSIPRSKLAIREAENKITEKVQNFRTVAATELQKIISEIKKFESKLVADEDILAKTEIISPVDGTIKQINKNTIGGVVSSGMDLIEIVPNSNTLLVEAKINPKDIAFINPNLKAVIKITAYDFGIYGGLEGKITEISADSIIDEESQERQSYYRIVVKTDKNYLERNGIKLPIIPGMIASVDIITGKKTILDFLLKPILKTKQNAFHER